MTKTEYIKQLEELMETPINAILKSLYFDTDFKSVVKVSEIVGFGANTIARRLKKVGVELDKGVPDERLVELYSEYKSIYKVGEIVGLNRNNVANRLKKAGIELRKDVPDERLNELYEKHESIVKVGEIVGLNQSTVSNRLKKVGIELYDQGEYTKQIEELMETPINAILKSLYFDTDFRSTHKVSEIVGLSAMTIAKKLKKAGIELYDRVEYIKQLEELMEAPINTILKSLYLDTDFKSIRKVGEIVGLGTATIARKLKKAGIELYDRGRHIRQLEELMETPIDAILKSLYFDTDFRSTYKVGEIVGLNPSIVVKRLQKAGIELRKDVPDERLKELYEKHESIVKIGEIVGLSGSAVYNRLKKAGIELGKVKGNLESALQAYRADYLGARGVA